eukprot:6491614-Pyramimonas_sp.AAC.1
MSPTFECPACSVDRPSAVALQRHIRTRIDLSDATFSFAVPAGGAGDATGGGGCARGEEAPG